jgi:hypothetical protein
VEICTVGSVRGEGVGAAMVNLNGHEAGNGGNSQGTPTAHRPLSYSERLPVSGQTHRQIIAKSRLPICNQLSRLFRDCGFLPSE